MLDDDAQRTTDDEPEAEVVAALGGLTLAAGLPAMADAPDPLLGHVLDGITIRRLIAEGGMGRVYEGLQDRPHRTVAVKVTRPGLASPVHWKRFEYEARLLARLRHPGIAHIYSVGVQPTPHGPVPYFVMEYVPDARTLLAFAAERGLSTRQRLELFRAVCEAVAHGHQKGVIHRDLKPGNILVDASGMVKVIDFGVARSTDADVALTTMLTGLGGVVGTIQYMSPEQLAGDADDIDVRSDVYSLGIVLHELLAGRPPYEVRGKSIVEAVRAIDGGDETRPIACDRGISGDVGVIVATCLQRDRTRRYAGASELAADIGRYLAGDPLMVRPPGLLEALWRLARRHRAAASAMTAGAAAIVAAVVGISAFWRRAELARVEAVAHAERAEEQSRVAAEQRQLAIEARERADGEAASALWRLYVANVRQLGRMAAGEGGPSAVRLLDETRNLCGADSLPIELRCIRACLDRAELVLPGFMRSRRGNGGPFAVSPDGRRFVAACDDGAARLHEVADGRLVATLVGHEGPVDFLAFSPDGTRILTGARDSTARAWDARTGAEIAVFRGHAAVISCIAWSPDGTRVVTGSEDKTSRVWDAATAKEMARVTLADGYPSCAAFCPDGVLMAVGSTDGTIGVGNLTTAAVVTRMRWDDHGIARLAFSPDGRRLVVGGSWGWALLLDAATFAEVAKLHDDVHEMNNHSQLCRFVLSPDGGRIVVTTGKVARLYDVDTGKQLGMLKGHSLRVNDVAFSRDGARVLTGSRDGTARVWDALTGEVVAVLSGHEASVDEVAFGHDDAIVTHGLDGTVRLWRVADCMDACVTVAAGSGSSREAAFSPDGRRLLTTSDPGDVRLWNVGTATEVARLPARAGHVDAAAFSPDGTRLVVAGGARSALWDIVTGSEIAELVSEGETITTVAFSPDGLRIATGERKGTIRLWDGSTGAPVGAWPRVELEQKALAARQAIFEGHTGLVDSLVFSPDGTRLLSATGRAVWNFTVAPAGSTPNGRWSCIPAEATARLWDASTGSSIAVYENVRAKLGAGAFRHDGRSAVIPVGREGRVISATGGSTEVTLQGHRSSVYRAAWSPDGRRIATVSVDGDVRVWDADSGRQEHVLEGHREPIETLEFSPDGSRLATASSDGTMRLWHVTTGAELAVLSGRRSAANRAVFSPNGDVVVAWSNAVEDTTISLWGISNADIVAARKKSAAIRDRLSPLVDSWFADGHAEAARELAAARARLSPEEHQEAADMVLQRGLARPVPSAETTEPESR